MVRQREFGFDGGFERDAVDHDFVHDLQLLLVGDALRDFVVHGHLREADGLVDLDKGCFGLASRTTLTERVEGFVGVGALKEKIGPFMFRGR